MKKLWTNGMALLALCGAFVGCSHEESFYIPTDEEAYAHAEQLLGLTIDPNQDWSMTQSGTVAVTANAGINATELLVLDAYPFGKVTANILAQAPVTEGQTVNLNYTAQKGLTDLYIACRNAQGDYRVTRIDISQTEVSFSGSNGRQAPTRAVVATPSVTEGDYTFNAKLARSWAGVNAAVHTGTDYNNYFSGMNNYSPWNNSGWNDKFYPVTGSIVESDYTDTDRNNIYQALQTVIPEQQDNLSKAQSTGYTIETKGGPVTLTPIHSSSNSNDQISYYYYPKNQVPSAEQIKTMPKYTLGKMGSELGKTYSLVYVDEYNVAKYEFPADYVICFLVSNTSQENANPYYFYESGGITTTTTTMGTLASTPSYSHRPNTDESRVYGSYANQPNNQYGNLGVRYGKTDWYDWSGTENPYNNFELKNDKDLESYGYTTRVQRLSTDGDKTNNGKNLNGGLDNGNTTYYLKANLYDSWNSYAMRVGVNCGKGVYVYELDDWDSTSGTIVGDWEDKGLSTAKTVIEFPIKDGKVYAVYGRGTKMTYYGSDIFKTEGGGTTSSTTEVKWQSMPICPEYYADGNLNTVVHQANNLDWGLAKYNTSAYQNNTLTAPHNAVFSWNGKNYLGFEDWVDFDYNDLVFEIEGTKGGEEITVTPPQKQIYSYAFEDSKKCDFDYNDVVLKVQENQAGDSINLRLVAAGATLDLIIRLYNWDDNADHNYGSLDRVLSHNGYTEVHDMLGVGPGLMVNTHAPSGKTATAKPITFTIPKGNHKTEALRLEIYSVQQGPIRIAGAGESPLGVIIPEDWKWPEEFKNISSCYNEQNTTEGDQRFSQFFEHAESAEHWYKYPTQWVMDESDL